MPKIIYNWIFKTFHLFMHIVLKHSLLIFDILITLEGETGIYKSVADRDKLQIPPSSWTFHNSALHWHAHEKNVQVQWLPW